MFCQCPAVIFPIEAKCFAKNADRLGRLDWTRIVKISAINVWPICHDGFSLIHIVEATDTKSISQLPPLKRKQPLVYHAPSRETAFDRPRDFLGNRFVYAVISSRAGGLSLGVNMNPDRRCNFDCSYCEVDRAKLTGARLRPKASWSPRSWPQNCAGQSNPSPRTTSAKTHGTIHCRMSCSNCGTSP
jgi:hypothetical protein